MASSSSGIPVPAKGYSNINLRFDVHIILFHDPITLPLFLAEAIQVLVLSLADESPLVRRESMSSLKDIVALYTSFNSSIL